MDGISAFFEGLFSGGIPFGLGLLILVLILFFAVSTLTRYIKKVPPNKALIVFGVGTRNKMKVLRRVEMTQEEIDKEYASVTADKRPRMKNKTEVTEQVVNFKIVSGGWNLVFPILQEFRYLDLDLQTLEVKVDNVLSAEAVPLTLDGIAQIKIGGGFEYIATAAEQMLGKTPEVLNKVARETLTGHLRAIIGLLTVEQVFKDRESFASQVLNVAVNDLRGMGLEIVSFVIKDISDGKGYLDALGAPQIQKKLSEARMATAENDQKAFQAEQEAMRNMAEYDRNTKLAQAHYASEVNKANAVATAAGLISQAEQERTLQEMMAAAAEVAALRTNKELDASVRFPAEASKFRVQQEAEAKLKTADADAFYTRQTGTAAAEVAGLTLLKQAEGQKELAAAYSKYGREGLQIVLGEKLIAQLPEMVDNASRPLGAVKEIKIIDFGNANGGETPLDKISSQGIKQALKVLESVGPIFDIPLNTILENMVSQAAAKSDQAPETTEQPDEAKDQNAGQ